jgi:phosphatidylglycerophosphatase A
VLFQNVLKYIATLGFIGYSPLAPGTLGSLAAFGVFVLLKPSPLAQAVILLIAIPVGIISSHAAERTLREKDSSHIVIDEVCGYFVSVLFLPFSITHALAAFFLFRIFDILKPFPIKKIENNFKGGLGVVSDDIMAGIYTNMILQIWIRIHQDL